MNIIALILCAVGLWIAFYFTGVSYRWFSADVKWVPPVCRLKESSCQLILETPRAKLFGVPNSVYGIGVYSYLILYFLGAPVWWAPGFIAMAFATVRSIYLVYSLLFITRIPCPLCFTSHAINLFLFIYLGFVR